MSSVLITLHGQVCTTFNLILELHTVYISLVHLVV